jgi:hypothetical protein
MEALMVAPIYSDRGSVQSEAVHFSNFRSVVEVSKALVSFKAISYRK